MRKDKDLTNRVSQLESRIDSLIDRVRRLENPNKYNVNDKVNELVIIECYHKQYLLIDKDGNKKTLIEKEIEAMKAFENKGKI